MRYFRTEIQRREEMIPLYRTIEFDITSNSTVHTNYNFFKKHVKAKTIHTESGDSENKEATLLIKGSNGWKEKSQKQFLKEVGEREIKYQAQ